MASKFYGFLHTRRSTIRLSLGTISAEKSGQRSALRRLSSACQSACGGNCSRGPARRYNKLSLQSSKKDFPWSSQHHWFDRVLKRTALRVNSRFRRYFCILNFICSWRIVCLIDALHTSRLIVWLWNRWRSWTLFAQTLGFSWPNAGGVVAAVQRVQRGMGFGSGCSSSSGHAGGLMVAQHQQYEIY